MENKTTQEMADQLMPTRKDSEITENETIIIAPHPDDEIIGCYEILTDNSIRTIVIHDVVIDFDRQVEAMKLRDNSNVKSIMFQHSLPTNLLSKSNTYYFPNPIYETHPKHREKGNVGEALLRSGFNVIFYSTEMNSPAKFECSTPDKKLELLNLIYPSQKSLWEYEHKFFLFSCYEKWLIGGIK
jgi:hypothetical protein